VPIQVPHVLAPAEDLTNEPFDRRKRSATVAVRVLGGFDGIERMQDSEVEGTDSSECAIAQCSPVIASS
jgi:hypothetical protein